MISGSPDMWRQVLANLTQNLNRHTPAGSPVAITLTSLGGMAVLMVDDAGPGIPLDQRVSVTERFTRLDASRSTTTGGFGLGMSVVSAVVARHQGTLELLDSPLGGLRVRITIPAA
jgi:two-component system OmpR family sensor kinase